MKCTSAQMDGTTRTVKQHLTIILRLARMPVISGLNNKNKSTYVWPSTGLRLTSVDIDGLAGRLCCRLRFWFWSSRNLFCNHNNVHPVCRYLHTYWTMNNLMINRKYSPVGITRDANRHNSHLATLRTKRDRSALSIAWRRTVVSLHIKGQQNFIYFYHYWTAKCGFISAKMWIKRWNCIESCWYLLSTYSF